MQSMSGDIDPPATGIPDLRTGIECCPRCQAEVVGQVMEWQEQSPVPGQRFARQLVDRRLRVLQCSQQCGWVVSGVPRRDLMGNQPGQFQLGLPERCPRGHQHSWAKLRRFGNRVDFVCAGLVNYKDGPKNQLCQLKAWVWIGDYHGFLKQRSATRYGETRNKILGVLSNHPEGAPLRTIVQETGLKQTTILGCLGRMLKARYPYLWHTDTPQPLPVGLGHRYSLIDRGWEFIDWGVQTRVYQPGEPNG